jgi:hypothetical protein
MVIILVVTGCVVALGICVICLIFFKKRLLIKTKREVVELPKRDPNPITERKLTTDKKVEKINDDQIKSFSSITENIDKDSFGKNSIKSPTRNMSIKSMHGSIRVAYKVKEDQSERGVFEI